MTSGRRAKSFGLAVVLAVATTLGAHAQLPVPATGASQLLSAAQISQLAAAQSETSPAASRRIAPVSAPRITSRPAGPAPSADIGGVLQIPGIGGGSVPWNVVVMLTALTLIP